MKRVRYPRRWRCPPIVRGQWWQARKSPARSLDCPDVSRVIDASLWLRSGRHERMSATMTTITSWRCSLGTKQWSAATTSLSQVTWMAAVPRSPVGSWLVWTSRLTPVAGIKMGYADSGKSTGWPFAVFSGQRGGVRRRRLSCLLASAVDRWWRLFSVG